MEEMEEDEGDNGLSNKNDPIAGTSGQSDLAGTTNIWILHFFSIITTNQALVLSSFCTDGFSLDQWTRAPFK